MSKMIFMSEAHVARMNEILATDAASRAACAQLERCWNMVYELSHGADTVWWTMRFDPAEGVSFSLEAPAQPGDVVFRGDLRAMLESMRRTKSGDPTPPPVTMHGDPGTMSVIGPAFQAASKVATLDTEIPRL